MPPLDKAPELDLQAVLMGAYNQAKLILAIDYCQQAARI
ncbi:MAG: DUF4058 family protein [Cyanobacteriota bacterium]|nr:DUF4058 family protein [Cyanobacteriota bacterium]